MLGIDISKDHLVCALLDDEGTAQQLTVPNSRSGIQQLLHATERTKPWVLEPTGPYCRDVVTMAQQAGRTVLLAEPKRARAYLQSVSPRAKTDRIDSMGLTAYARAIALRPFPQKSEIVEQIEQLLAARKGISQSITRLRLQRDSLPHAREALDPAISELQARRDAIDAQINEIRDNCPELADLTRRLKAVPGIGAVTANALAICLSSRDFRHSDQFVAFTGLDIQVHDSGRRQGKRRISKQGNAELRRLLYVAAMATIRSRDEHNPFKQQYQRELNKGLPKPGAICAVARKLARTAWSLHRYQSTYDPSRVNQQPH
jgi:transposase